MAQITELYRHPIKSHGREALTSAVLEAGKTFPWDRVWAISHERSKFDPAHPAWTACGSFARGSKASQLMAINAVMDEKTGAVTLTHPKLGSLTCNPDLPEQAQTLIDWVQPIMPPDWFKAVSIAKAPDRGMTDTDFPSISLMSHSSNAEVAAAAKTEVSPLRWRGNIWFDGTAPWAERDWIGKTVEIGETVLEILEPVIRCNATRANPETGSVDIDTLKILADYWDHQEFGVYGVVVKGGPIQVGDAIRVI